MPTLIINGLPRNTRTDQLRPFLEDIGEAVEGIAELQLPREKVTVIVGESSFDFVIQTAGFKTGIVLTLDGLFERKERTPEVISKLSNALGECITKHFPNLSGRVIVSPPIPPAYCWSSKN